jgi:hypothetical protein
MNWDHLWPWSRTGFQAQRTLQAAGLALAVARPWCGCWPPPGRMRRCHDRLVVRLERVRSDGAPRWQALREGRAVVAAPYRVASIMDMLCYVGFKNLLIGASLFLVLKAMGILSL